MISLLEPIGTAAPKFSSVLKSATLEFSSLSGIALTCPAQASPLPAFRYFGLHLLMDQFSNIPSRTCWNSCTKVFLLLQILNILVHVWIRDCIDLSSSGFTITSIQVLISQPWLNWFTFLLLQSLLVRPLLNFPPCQRSHHIRSVLV